MARKNILSGLMNATNAPPVEQAAPEQKSTSGVKSLGALGAVTRSIDQLAARADAARQLEEQIARGGVVIDLQPDQLENSFISDRIAQDDEAFQALVEAIRLRGQDSPILVRPHPNKPGKYQIAFGHRRARAARELGIPVKAVVKSLSDVDHVVAQGQENSARADLSFIERALFASKLSMLNFSRETIMAALGSDKTTISKMLSVTSRIPGDVLNMINDARMIGRDRWHEMATLFDDPDAAERARAILHARHQPEMTPEERFERLARGLKQPAKAAVSADQPATTATPERRDWTRQGRAVKARITARGDQVTIALSKAEGRAFGDYIASQLDRLFEAFEQQTSTTNGE